ncbi:hypothetical protein TSUD_361330 [Trifolium subterraneum]|uniref:S-protein homolog n=1 Tax=Trifolium subterraneum TaxID=3900 RepID=A0A2Z6M324_TRISU|nr:hypothetical protein TSUD_361330 [Trifolium subterraneum]
MTASHVHCRFGGGQMNTKTTTVRVENDLKVDTILSLHCRSSGNDLGEKTLHSGHWVEWSFHANSSGTTRYSCVLKWNNLQKDVIIYDATKDAATCTSKCWRGISADGVYFFNEFKNSWEKQYSWN